MSINDVRHHVNLLPKQPFALYQVETYTVSNSNEAQGLLKHMKHELPAEMDIEGSLGPIGLKEATILDPCTFLHRPSNGDMHHIANCSTWDYLWRKSPQPLFTFSKTFPNSYKSRANWSQVDCAVYVYTCTYCLQLWGYLHNIVKTFYYTLQSVQFPSKLACQASCIKCSLYYYIKSVDIFTWNFLCRQKYQFLFQLS